VAARVRIPYGLPTGSPAEAPAACPPWFRPIPPIDEIGGGELWRSGELTILTHRSSDLTVQLNLGPDGCPDKTKPCIPSTGWHTHPGPSFVIVTQGSITSTTGCTPSAGRMSTRRTRRTTPSSIPAAATSTSPGNESGALVQGIVVRLTPAGSTPRMDAADPGKRP
jgi:hypothetical protein